MNCRMCGQPAEQELLVGTLSVFYVGIPLCNAHLAAMRLNEWWLTIKLMDKVSTIRGKPVGDGFEYKPDF